MSKIYSLLFIEQSELDKFITENLSIDWIKSSKFSIAILVFFIKKKNSFI